MAPTLILRPGNSCVDKCFGGAQWAKDLRDLHLGVTFAALQASTISTWTMVCPGTMVHKAEGAHSFHRTQPDVIDESVVGAALLYEAVAQAFLDVGEELVKKGAKSPYNHKRVAFKGGGEMSCYQLCMTTLVGCPCV